MVQFTLHTLLELRLDFCPEILFVVYRHNEQEGWAYGAVHAHADEQRWYATVHAKAEEINTIFTESLGFSEVRATAKSEAKRVWQRRHEPYHYRS
nr:hypothetical protein WG70_12190 [Burkholderia oklahomensis EO147]